MVNDLNKSNYGLQMPSIISTMRAENTINNAIPESTESVIATLSEYMFSKAIVTQIEHSKVIKIAKNHKTLYLLNRVIMIEISRYSI